MGEMECKIRIESADNGWTVHVPDYAMMREKMAAGKKSGDMMPYMGECEKEYIATSVKDVLSIVKTALEAAPESEYDTAFEAATAMK
jgi:hypothetical protein